MILECDYLFEQEMGKKTVKCLSCEIKELYNDCRVESVELRETLTESKLVCCSRHLVKIETCSNATLTPRAAVCSL